MRRHAALIALLLAFVSSAASAVAFPRAAFAADGGTFNTLNTQLMYGEGFKNEKSSKVLNKSIWANRWAYGDNFAFCDVARPFGKNDSYYCEWMPRLSYSKITGTTFDNGLFRDLALVGMVETNFRGTNTFLAGVGIDPIVPGLNSLKLSINVRDNRDLPGETWQFTANYDTAFLIGPTRWTIGGFADWRGAEGKKTGGPYSYKAFLLQPQLNLDLGHFWGMDNKVYGGVQMTHWNNKNGRPGIDETVYSAMIKVVLF